MRGRPADPSQPHILYLNFEGGPMHGASDCSDATMNCSFIIAMPQVVYPKFGGSDDQKAAIIQLVKRHYAPFNVQIVTERPQSGTYSMDMIGGSPMDIGVTAGAVGIAPLDCGSTSDVDISFTFSTMVANDPLESAITTSQESGHGYGLGHTDSKLDVMFPVVNQSGTGFQNKLMNIYDVSGGSSDCNGTGVQNSFQQLATNVGMAAPDMTPPVVTLTAPSDGMTVAADFTIRFQADDERGVAGVDLLVDGQMRGTNLLPPYSFDILGGSLGPGTVHIVGVARDNNGNVAMTPAAAITVKKLGDTPGDLGTACQVDTDCTGGGFCVNHACSRACSAALACPTGFECQRTQMFTSQCIRQPEDSGCSAHPGAGHAGVAGLLAALMLAMRGKRRRS